MQTAKHVSRRRFMSAAAAATAAFTLVPRHVLGGPGQVPPSEKLNIAHIGIGGRGAAQLDGCSSENCVAHCDVDERRAAGDFARYPNAKRFTDFRKMLDAVENEIDAVCISTPDHTHAVAVMNAPARQARLL